LLLKREWDKSQWWQTWELRPTSIRSSDVVAALDIWYESSTFAIRVSTLHADCLAEVSLASVDIIREQ
jgi:hypothetical protein